MTPHERSLYGCFAICIGATLLAIALSLGGAYVWLRESGENAPPPGYLGDVERGRELVARYGCPSCHSGVGDAPQGNVGPPLEHIGDRAYIAGHFPNTQIRMIEWIRHPQSLRPGSGMPDLGVTEADARDLSAFLATLR